MARLSRAQINEIRNTLLPDNNERFITEARVREMFTHLAESSYNLEDDGNINAGDYGSETEIPIITVNDLGLIESISVVTVNIPSPFNAEDAQDAVAQSLLSGNASNVTIQFSYDDAGNIINAEVQNTSLSNAKLALMPANAIKVNSGVTAAEPQDLMLVVNSVLGRLNGNLQAIPIGGANGLVTTDANNKIDIALLPPIQLTNPQIVANQSARLALTGVEIGDVVRQSDNGEVYMLGDSDPSQNANWVQIGDLSPDWSAITSKPSTFPPSAHNQDWSTIDNKPDSAEGIAGIIQIANQAEAQTAQDATLNNRNHTKSLTARSWRLIWDLFLTLNWVWSGVQSFNRLILTVSSPSQLTANQNNYDLGTANVFIRLSANAARDVTGIVAETEGRYRQIMNVGSFDITFRHESTSSTATNRITSASGADIVLQPGQVLTLIYDGTSTRWRAWRDSATEVAVANIQNTATTNVDFVTGRRFWSGIAHFITQAWTWTGKQTFNTSAPRFNTPTANTILRTDANKDLADSGLSDDGTRVSANRRFRFWNQTADPGTPHQIGDSYFNTALNSVRVYISATLGYLSLFNNYLSTNNKVLGRVSLGAGVVEELDVVEVVVGEVTLASGTASVNIGTLVAGSLVTGLTARTHATESLNGGSLRWAISGTTLTITHRDGLTGAIITSSNITVHYRVEI